MKNERSRVGLRVRLKVGLSRRARLVYSLRYPI